ncbi:MULTISPECIES: hypothetical protein [unclassified Paenibacillus]|uniref:hypothetical protein n=1 Tax=unclassified Paenibacillus TaxID=185978 RepID=UPI000CFC3D7F|nr:MULTISPECIES: hypothetical protein [unclassified Paenibacillus]PRA08868.1 hypothetical protein CQ043_02505 [Paenibacillus sp. MYb63]PRA48802.1 hypothetical protein CQ061_10960 [Paenibacillus sp. MYb67]
MTINNSVLNDAKLTDKISPIELTQISQIIEVSFEAKGVNGTCEILCETAGNAARVACEGLNNPIARAICIQAANAAESACKDQC